MWPTLNALAQDSLIRSKLTTRQIKYITHAREHTRTRHAENNAHVYVCATLCGNCRHLLLVLIHRHHTIKNDRKKIVFSFLSPSLSLFLCFCICFIFITVSYLLPLNSCLCACRRILNHSSVCHQKDTIHFIRKTACTKNIPIEAISSLLLWLFVALTSASVSKSACEVHIATTHR